MGNHVTRDEAHNEVQLQYMTSTSRPSTASTNQQKWLDNKDVLNEEKEKRTFSRTISPSTVILKESSSSVMMITKADDKLDDDIESYSEYIKKKAKVSKLEESTSSDDSGKQVLFAFSSSFIFQLTLFIYS